MLQAGIGSFPNTAALLAALPVQEPSIVWLAHQDSSTGPREVSIDEDNKTELNLAVMSDSGACYYLRVDLTGPSARRVVQSAATCEAHDYQGGPDTGW